MKPNDNFIRESERIISESPASGEYYILYIDITDFHLVNYIYGNKIGDLLLQEINDFLDSWQVVRLCHRIFADFFLCLCFLEEGADLLTAAAAWDAELQAFLTAQQSKYPACGLKAACGVCRVDNGNATQAIDNSNVARKLSKNEFTVKTIVYNHTMKEKIKALHENESEIYHALQEKRFCFYLQPKVDLTTGKVIGAEALARCIAKDGEIITPDRFMDLMEANGSIIDLDQIICHQVCAFLKDRIDRNLPVVCISVNLSRLHIHNPDSADIFHCITEEYKIPPELMEFELTETILLEEFAGAKQLIDRLRAFGHHVSIDDFGSGYAGINIWQELSFDCLKLDRKFLSDNPSLIIRNNALLPNLINIAHRLHVQVLCEGTETEEQCLYLLRLGCTVVQGFYFSKPLPPEQLFEIFEKQEGKYPLPVLLCSEKKKGKPKLSKEPAIQREALSRLKSFWLLILCCALFLGASITGVMAANRFRTQREFSRMIIDTLNAYTSGQREKTLARIDGVVNTLQSLAVLIMEKDDPDFIDTYMLALNETSSEVKYTYDTVESYGSYSGTDAFEDTEAFQRLTQGETIVTDVAYSEALGNIYYVSVKVPVIKDGQFTGAVQGIINAEALVSTDLYDPGIGEICAVFLTDGDSRILPIRSSDGRGVGQRLLEYLDAYHINETAAQALLEAYKSKDDKAASFRVGVFDSSPYYLSMTGLKYNDWHLVVCLKADTASAHYRYIIYNMMASIAILIAAVILTSAAMVIYWKKVQRKFSLEEQRYHLLEYFSDTVLFDYDCHHDTIRFTSNAQKLLRVPDLTQYGFLAHLDCAYIYAGDLEEVFQVLNGHAGGEFGEIRIRLMRPDAEEYFWCLVQYQNFYTDKKLDLIIGKITDIDEHMPHDDAQ